VSLAVDLGLVNFLSFTFERAPDCGFARMAVFGGRPRRLARLDASAFLLCLFGGVGVVGVFEVGRRVRRAADIVSFIFSGATAAE
jgi:hypothetical protein